MGRQVSLRVREALRQQQEPDFAPAEVIPIPPPQTTAAPTRPSHWCRWARGFATLGVLLFPPALCLALGMALNARSAEEPEAERTWLFVWSSVCLWAFFASAASAIWSLSLLFGAMATP